MRISKSITLVSVVLFFFIILLNCNDLNKQSVARVGGRKISVPEFEKKFAEGKRTREVQAASLEDKKKYLEKLINEKLQLVEAYQHKLDQDEKIKQVVEERKKNLLFRRLVEREVVDKIITDDKIKEYYKNASQQVKIRQIVLNYDKNMPEDMEKKTELAQSIFQRIKAGESFAELAKEFSHDKQSAIEGGMKSYLKWSPAASSNPVLVAAFSLKQDEISEPIVAPDGIYIIKVIHIKKFPAPPFEQEKEKIKQSIFRIFNKEIEQAYYDYLTNLKRKYKVKFNETNINFFLTQLQSNSNTLNRQADANSRPAQGGLEAVEKLSPKETEKMLADSRAHTITIADLIKNIKQIPTHRQPTFRTANDVREYLDKRMMPIYLLEKEIDVARIANDGQFKVQIQTIAEDLMIREIYQRQVSDQVKLSEADYLKYFEENRQDYKNPPMREVQEIYVADEKLAKQIVDWARAGRNFTELFKKYNEKKANEKNLGKLGFISEGRGGLGKPAFAARIGGVTDPILIGKGYSILKILNEKPEELKTYDESRKLVESRLRRLRVTEMESQWLEQLRKKIDTVVYENNLEQSCKKYIGSDVILIE